MIGFIIWLVIVLFVAAAVLGVVRALLALPIFQNLQPYVNVIYALIVLLMILIIVQMMYSGVPYDFYPHRVRP